MPGTEPIGNSEPKDASTSTEPHLEVDPPIDSAGSASTTKAPAATTGGIEPQPGMSATEPGVVTPAPVAPPAAEPMPGPVDPTSAVSPAPVGPGQGTVAEAPEQPKPAEPTQTEPEDEKPKKSGIFGLFGRLADMVSAKPEDVEKVETKQAKMGINTTGEHPVMDTKAMAQESQRLADLRAREAKGDVRVPSADRATIGTGTIEPTDQSKAS